MAPKKPKPDKPEKPTKPASRVLFILKAQGSYGSYSTTTKSSGLQNSAQFVVDMLNANGLVAKMEIVVDNNDIDRVVTAFQADYVIIEALWVVPDKFAVLRQLHPHVKWIVRLHSEIPFLAQEGIAVEWAFQYPGYGVYVAFNSERTYNYFLNLYKHSPYPGDEDFVMYLPNFYPITDGLTAKLPKHKSIVHIGAFGAIRPLKNQLIQAAAAIEFAARKGVSLVYHINGSRVEQRGESGLKNIRALFTNFSTFTTLVEHPWLARTEFLNVVKEMDLGLQMSFTESFNIIVADLVSCNIPVVTSPEVRWVDKSFRAEPTNLEDIITKMNRAYFWKTWVPSVNWNLSGLEDYCKDSQRVWLTEFKR